MIDTPQRPANLEPLKATLKRAAASARRTVISAAIYQLAWQWLALLAGLFVLDLVFAMPEWLRWITLLGQAVFLVWGIRRISILSGQMRYTDEWAARIVEGRRPEVDNALINAIQFDRILRQAPAEQIRFMERELTRAELVLPSIQTETGTDRTAERRAARNLAVIAVGWVLLAVLFSAGFVAIMPRLFEPWMDAVTPPFSVTHFDVRPPGATVKYGDSLDVAVNVTGQTPDTMTLMVRGGTSDWQRVPLDSTSPGAYTATLDNLQNDTWYYVQANTGRSARYLVTVTRPPVVTSLNVTYTYPSYTAKLPSTETVGQDGIHGLAGTGVVFHIGSNRALMGGHMTVQGDGIPDITAPVLVDAKTATDATVSFTITRPGNYNLSLQTPDGQTNDNAAKGKIVLDKDQRPNVWIVSPAQDILVTPDMTVPIDVQADDDEGVANVEVHRMINDLSDIPHSYPSSPPLKQASSETVMDLKDLGVRPGDRIAYFASAYDNRPGDPDIGETETYTMKVVTPAEYQAALKQQRTPADLNSDTSDIVSAVKDLADQQKALADRMNELQKQLAKKPGDASLKQQLADARKEQADLQQHAAKLAQEIAQYSQSPSASPLEAALKKKMAQIAQQMASAAQGPMKNAQNGSPAQATAAAKAAADQLGKASSQMQNQVQAAVQHLAEVAPLYNDVERFMDLLNQQGQLVLKARQFQQSSGSSVGDKARLDELASEQSNIDQSLKQLQQDFLSHADAAQADFPKAAASARKIAAEIGRRNIPGLMQNAHTGFQQWNGPQGFENAQSALQQMQAMVGQARAGQGTAQGELDISLAQSLGQKGLGSSLGQLGAANGEGQGQGMGFGIGGMQSGQSGQTGGGTSVYQSAKAYTPSTQSINGTGGDKKRNHRNTIGAGPGVLAPSDVEVMKNPNQKLLNAGDRNANRYPPEYRQMIGDYFKTVAEGK